MVYQGRQSLQVQTREGLFRRYLSADKFGLFIRGLPFSLALALILWASVLGDGFISTDQRPERESWRSQLEMIIGGD